MPWRAKVTGAIILIRGSSTDSNAQPRAVVTGAGHDIGGEPIEDFVAKWDAGSEYEHSLVDRVLDDGTVVGDPEQSRITELEADLKTAQSVIPYDKLSVEAVQAEVDKRGLVVTGTGAGGAVKKSDNVKALQEDDAAKA